MRKITKFQLDYTYRYQPEGYQRLISEMIELQ